MRTPIGRQWLRSCGVVCGVMTISAAMLLSSSWLVPMTIAADTGGAVLELRLGSLWRVVRHSAGCSEAYELLPGWIVVAAGFIVTAMLWCIGEPKEDRNTCSACGYDLRENSSGRCPECGKRIAGIRRPE